MDQRLLAISFFGDPEKKPMETTWHFDGEIARLLEAADRDEIAAAIKAVIGKASERSRRHLQQ